jgi:hypothetical protein
LGERLLCKQEVIGSIPFTSTIARANEGALPCAVAWPCAKAAVSFFNNLEEAKRIGALMRGADDGL